MNTIPLTFDGAVQKIAKALQPERILLFGSRARNTHYPASDYDLLLICDSGENPLELASRALLAARPRRFALDVSVLTPSEFEESLDEKTDFVWHAMQDAKVIYEKANPSMGAPS